MKFTCQLSLQTGEYKIVTSSGGELAQVHESRSSSNFKSTMTWKVSSRRRVSSSKQKSPEQMRILLVSLDWELLNSQTYWKQLEKWNLKLVWSESHFPGCKSSSLAQSLAVFQIAPRYLSLSRERVLCVLHLSSLSRKSEKILKAAAAKAAAADGCSLASIYLFQAAKRVLRERAESF